MERQIFNYSDKVERVEVTSKMDIFNWSEKHKSPIISNANLFDIEGYSRITHELYAKYYGDKYYVIESFDGSKRTVTDALLFWTVVNRTLHRGNGRIANVCKQYDQYNDNITNSCNVLISDQYEISKRNYVPSIDSIQNYIDKHGNDRFIHAAFFEDIEITKTKMLKVDFESLLKKLKLIGVPYMLVDLNTIATCQNDNKLRLYTRQKSIEE